MIKPNNTKYTHKQHHERHLTRVKNQIRMALHTNIRHVTTHSNASSTNDVTWVLCKVKLYMEVPIVSHDYMTPTSLNMSPIRLLNSKVKALMLQVDVLHVNSNMYIKNALGINIGLNLGHSVKVTSWWMREGLQYCVRGSNGINYDHDNVTDIRAFLFAIIDF